MPTVSKLLTVARVVDYYDGPLIFTAVDAIGTRYLCAFLQQKEEGTEYLAVPVSLGRLNSFLKGTLDLRSVFLEPEVEEYFLILTTSTSDTVEAVPVDLSSIRENLLPAAGYFAEHQEDEPDEIVRNRTVIEASLDIPEARNATVIDSYTLAELLFGIQDSIKYGYKKKIARLSAQARQKAGEPQYYTFQAYKFSISSFTIHLRSALTGSNLIGYSELDEAVALVAKFLQLASNPAEALALLREYKGHFVAAIRRLIEVPVERKCAMRFGWRTSEIGARMTRHSVSYDEATTLQRVLADASELQDELIDLEGVFVNVKTTGRKPEWTIQTDDGLTHTGHIDPSKTISLFGITVHDKRYLVRCKERIWETAAGKQQRDLWLYDYKDITHAAAPSSKVAEAPDEHSSPVVET